MTAVTDGAESVKPVIQLAAPPPKDSDTKDNKAIDDVAVDPVSSARPGDRGFISHDGRVTWPLTDTSATNHSHPHYAHTTNAVISSKYTWWNFLPLNLFEQFQNVANLYFLFVGILQVVRAVSTTNGIPTMYEPLAFIVFISALRAAKEDYDKHVSDNKRNSYLFAVLRDGSFIENSSGSLRVGEVVKIQQNDMMPADCLFLASSHSKGHCFLDKANLNGETRLEVMNSMIQTRALVQSSDSDASVKSLSLTLVYEPPNKHFDSFRGYLSATNNNDSRHGAIDGKSLLMRETILRNTEFIYALVVYTGDDTKIQRSNLEGEKAKTKQSSIMRLVDRLLKCMLLLQVALCLLGGILAGSYHDSLARHWYLASETGYNSIETGVLAFFTWFILLSSMVPISLIVSSEMVKFMQSIFIHWDVRLYSSVLNKTAKCNNSSIHEDLGCIDYIFSDKTGTLTQNKMEFRYALLDGGQLPPLSHSQPHALADGQQQSPPLSLMEFGSKETDIAKSVKVRQQELQQRHDGHTQPRAPRKAWTDLEAPFYAPGDERDLQTGCVDRYFPRLKRWIWSNNDPWNTNQTSDSVMESEARASAAVKLATASVSPGDVTQPITSAKSTTGTSTKSNDRSNTFTDPERDHLLTCLWGAPFPTESAAECARRKLQLFQYLLNMALSNTVKPYEENGELCYQAESAEELSMVEFARKMGFIKRSINPTVVEIICYEESDGKRERPLKRIETFNHVATFGFTSKRARVTVIYQRVSSKDEQGRTAKSFTDSVDSGGGGGSGTNRLTAESIVEDNTNPSHRPFIPKRSPRLYPSVGRILSHPEPISDQSSILVMTKGQDTVILPFLSLAHINEQSLMLSLKDMSMNGLRTLVCGYSEQSLTWWRSHEKEYQSAISKDSSEASEGHPDKCKQIGGDCERCLQHSVFEVLESAARLRFIGVLGLEDQLQPLVPECIADCLQAGIKVWMITGDKLETAKNIGLACNLIDADMMPNIDAVTNIATVVDSCANARLIEVTGQWANLSDNVDEMSKFFDSLDADSNGVIDQQELLLVLKTLRFAISEEKVKLLMIENLNANGITRLDFLELMRSTRLSAYEAVKYDIETGINIYNSITDHQTFPVSVLVDRHAFQVLFPSLPKGTKGAGKQAHAVGDTATHASTDTGAVIGPSPAELELLRAQFFALAQRSKSVVFARAEPAMKKRMVTEIQARVPGAITLAIGDGANDTDMIQAASIGVGIAGVEGTAATNSADYAIGAFRMLHTLLFVHGYWSYHRQSKLVYFIFYKASLVAVAMFLFGFYSAFSGQQFFDDPIYQIYNVIYTALPVIAMAVLDQPLSARMLQSHPLAYQSSRHRAFTARSFTAWIARAFVHAIAVFFVPFASLGLSDVNFRDGRNGGLWFFSTIVYMCVVLIPTFLILFEMASIAVFQTLVVVLSVSALILINYIINSPLLAQVDTNIYTVVDEIYQCPNAWLTILITVALPLLIEAAWRGYQREYRPQVAQVLQERTSLQILRQADPRTQSSNDSTADAASLHLPIDIRKDCSASRPTEPSAFVGSSPDFRHQLVTAMLRMRNLSGGQFDSAAQAHLQPHDHCDSPRNSQRINSQCSRSRTSREGPESMCAPTNAANAHKTSTQSLQQISPRLAATLNSTQALQLTQTQYLSSTAPVEDLPGFLPSMSQHERASSQRRSANEDLERESMHDAPAPFDEAGDNDKLCNN